MPELYERIMALQKKFCITITALPGEETSVTWTATAELPPLLDDRHFKRTVVGRSLADVLDRIEAEVRPLGIYDRAQAALDAWRAATGAR